MKTQLQKDIGDVSREIVLAKHAGVDALDILDAVMIDIGRIASKHQPKSLGELRHYYEKLVLKKN
jgi:hypothetical protein